MLHEVAADGVAAQAGQHEEAGILDAARGKHELARLDPEPGSTLPSCRCLDDAPITFGQARHGRVQQHLDVGRSFQVVTVGDSEAHRPAEVHGYGRHRPVVQAGRGKRSGRLGVDLVPLLPGDPAQRKRVIEVARQLVLREGPSPTVHPWPVGERGGIEGCADAAPRPARTPERPHPRLVERVIRGADRIGPRQLLGRLVEGQAAALDQAARFLGDLLKADFDRTGGVNECHLSVGDSSGAMFITNGGAWRLAGINYAVDGFFSLTGSSTDQFDAALMDAGGLYVGSGTNWGVHHEHGTRRCLRLYCTRISANLAWINSVIDYLPADDLQIEAMQVTGNDVSISFATTNRLYYVQRSDDLNSGTWTTFTNNVPGTGGIVSVIDVNAATLTNRFYRLGLVP